MSIHDDADAKADAARRAVYDDEFARRDQAARVELEKARTDETMLRAALAVSDGQVGELREKLANAQTRITELERLLEPVKETSPGLFFRLPGNDELVRPNFAFDHGWPFFWESRDNKPNTDQGEWYAKNFLPVQGEKGLHAAYGGAHRNRLLNNAPYPAGTNGWVRSMVADTIRTKLRYGLGGTFMNLITTAADHATYYNAYRDEAAANFPDFKVVPMVDATGSIAKDKTALASVVASFLRTPNRLELDGKLAVGSFSANSYDRAWWADLATRLKTLVGREVTFIHVINGSVTKTTITARDQYALGHWEAGADPLNYANGYAGEADLVRSTGARYVASIEAQNVRPRQDLFDESVGTAALIAAWDRAIKDNADFAQLVTWQDLWEGTEFAPSAMRGTVLLELNAYKMTEWLTGEKPDILRDYISIAYRNQLLNAKITGGQTRLMQKWPRSQSPLTDKLEVRTILPKPDKVTVTIGGVATSYDAPAGESVKLVDVRAGKVLLRTGRGEVIDSPIPIRSTSGNQDRGYVMLSNIGPTERQYDPTPA